MATRCPALLLTATAAAASATLSAMPTRATEDSGGGGFPCEDFEYVSSTWRPPQEAECHSCYGCAPGQTCHRRGGCLACAASEHDADGDPTSPCVPCPEGQTSTEGATTCAAIEPSPWDKFISIDTKLQAVIGVSVLTALCFLLFLGCKRCCPGLLEYLAREWREFRSVCAEADGGAEPDAIRAQGDAENPSATTSLAIGVGDGATSGASTWTALSPSPSFSRSPSFSQSPSLMNMVMKVRWWVSWHSRSRTLSHSRSWRLGHVPVCYGRPLARAMCQASLGAMDRPLTPHLQLHTVLRANTGSILS
jgi:hypothetical protein